jgi:CRP-like cAMP-binding protein
MLVRGVFLNASACKTVLAGETIFKKGDRGDVMYGVIEGQVEIVNDGKVIATVEKDDVFGEMALIDKAPRSASAIAKTDCKLAIVNEHLFLFLVQETPTFALQVMSVMAERIRRLSGAIE